MQRLHLSLAFLAALLLLPATSHAKGVEALFSTDRTLAVPFNTVYPSNLFTVPDPSHNTGLRLNILNPDCQVFVSYCEGLVSTNELDGFNLQPLLQVRFSGPIDVTTVNSNNFFLIRLGDTLPSGDQSQKIVDINQISFHTEHNVLSAESDEFLDQHTRYAVIVTREIRDSEGQRVRASKEFKKFRKDSPTAELDAYWESLQEAFRAAKKFKINESHIVAASVFTTQSATAVLEKIRDQIKANTPAPADFNLGPSSTRTVFTLNDITAITHTQQVKANASDPAAFEVSFLSPLLVPLLRQVPGAVQQVAYGKYQSPNYLTPGQFIPGTGTRTGTPVVQETDEIFFTVFLPSGTKPPGGWPVAIYGHGSFGNKDGESYFFAAHLATRGIATIAITATGHGTGPLSTLTINQNTTPPLTFPSGGRGFDQNNDGAIDFLEGHSAAPPRAALSNRDGLRQTVVDLMQLVRQLEVGMDIDGDTVADLDPTRIYYFGVSNGGIYGTTFLAVEPRVRVGVPNVAGGSGIEVVRQSPIYRPLLGFSLSLLVPSLINVGGPSGFEFNENIPLRNQPPLLNNVPGAFALQANFDGSEALSQAANSVAYAVHLRKKPLVGVPAKSVIIQFARGDQQVANAGTTAMLRAGNLADRSSFYRHDLAFADPLRNPTGTELPVDAHPFLFFNLVAPTNFDISVMGIHQIVEFFASDGQEAIDPDGPGPLFETPIAGPLPEDCGYVVPIPGFTACQ